MRKLSSQSALVVAGFMICMASPEVFAAASPKATVKAAYKAAAKNNLKKLRRELMGDALVKFGNRQGLAIFRAQAEKFNKIKAEEILLRAEHRKSVTTTYFHVDIFGQTFTTDRDGGQHQIAETQIRCETIEHRYHHCPPRSRVRGCLDDDTATRCAIFELR